MLGNGRGRVVRDMQRRRSRFWLPEFLVATAMTVAILTVGTTVMGRASLNATEMMAVRHMEMVPQFQAAKLIPASLASGEDDGYRFVMTATPGGYTLVATPEVFGKTERRTFFLDQDGTIHQNWGQEVASVDSPEFK